MAEPDDDNGDPRTVTVNERVGGKRVGKLSRGVLLGRYEIVDELGEGGMGVVYRAHDRELGRDVALKVVTTDQNKSGSHGHTRLMREAQALAQLSHPNVIAVFDVGRVDDGVFIAMELVEGLRLDQWLRAKPRRWREILAVFRDAGRALAAAHAVGLVHRDVKPANLMIASDGRVRVLDFGLARAADALMPGAPTITPRPDPHHQKTMLGNADEPATSDLGPRAADADTQPRAADPPTQPRVDSAKHPRPLDSGQYPRLDGQPAQLPTDVATQPRIVEPPTQPRLDSAKPPRPSPSPDGARKGEHARVPEPSRERNAPELVAVPLHAERSGPSSQERTGPSLGTLLEAPLTEVGAIVGTPPYMAPEQHLGGACTPRSDQFSFCVTFYQALYGERPFTGLAYDDLVDAIVSGRVRPAPAKAHVPSWLRRILLKGLSPQPNDRYPSMQALIDDLGRDPAQRWRRLGAGAAVVAVAGLAAAGYWRVVKNAERVCAGVEEAVHAAWSDQRRQEVLAAFRATQLPYAADAAKNVVRVFDGYAAAWSAMRTDACTASRVRGTQSGELMDLRMQCLDRRLEEFKAQVDVLATADVRVVENAPQAVQSLSRLDGCADAAALRAPVRPPADPMMRSRVEKLRQSLARAKADLATGKINDGVLIVEPAVREAHVIGYRPTEGDALFTQGRLYDVDGKYDDAERALRDAAMAAEAGRDDTLAARALSYLVWVVGERKGRYAEAREVARQAQAKIERQDHGELLMSELDGFLSSVEMDDGKYAAAQARSKEALDIRERVLGPNEPEVAHSLSDLGDIAVQLGRYDEALGYYRRALAIYEKTLGPQHPNVGSVLTNVGAALRSQGKYDEALVYYRRARKVVEDALGPQHPNLAPIYVNEAGVLRAQGKLDAATQEYELALGLWMKALGPDHPNVGTVYYYLGAIALEEGKLPVALQRFHQALKLWETRLGMANPSLAAPLTGIADALRRQHKPAEAHAPLERAIAIVEKALGAQHPEMSAPLDSLGQLFLDENRPDKAIAPLERALAIHVANPGDKVEEANSRFLLARALRGARRDPARAHELAAQARAAFAGEATATAHAQLAAVDKFLRVK